MVVAAAGAAFLGHWAEGVVLLFLFSLGNTLETFAFGRTRRSIQALMELRPASASKLEGDEEVQVGIETLVRETSYGSGPGSEFPWTDEWSAGESPVNESTLTGEAVPLGRGLGTKCSPGHSTAPGTLDLQVTRLAEDTTLARVIRMVEEAREAQAPAQSWIERTGEQYAGVVLLGALVAVVIPMAVLWTGASTRPSTGP